MEKEETKIYMNNDRSKEQLKPLKEFIIYQENVC